MHIYFQEADRLVRNAQGNLSKCQIKCASYEERLDRLQTEGEQRTKTLTQKDQQILQLNQKVGSEQTGQVISSVQVSCSKC